MAAARALAAAALLAAAAAAAESGSGGSSSLRGAASPPPATRRPVIIDTDVDTDDMLAIAYLLAEPTIEVKAISVLADGWSHQWSGVVNVMRLTQFFGQPDIPVAYSPKYNSDTQLNLREPNGLPRPSLLPGIDNFLSEYVPLAFNERPPSWMYGPRLVRETLRQSASPMDVIELGPLTTLAQVLQEEPELLRAKVRTLYFSGGDVLPRTAKETDKVWPYSAGNASAGGGATSYTGAPPGGVAWNVFSDPVAANSVFSFGGLELVLATSGFHGGLRFHRNDSRFIPPSCDAARASFLNSTVLQLPAADGEKPDQIKYWDQGTAVLAIQMMRQDGENQTAAVCTRFDQRRFAVMMEDGDNATVSGGRYSRLLESSFGQLARQCLQANETEFKLAFYAGVCGGLH